MKYFNSLPWLFVFVVGSISTFAAEAPGPLRHLPKRIDIPGHPPIESIKIEDLKDIKGTGKVFVGQGEVQFIPTHPIFLVGVDVKVKYNPKKGIAKYTVTSGKGSLPKIKAKFKTVIDDLEHMTSFKLKFKSTTKEKIKIKKAADVVLKLPPPPPTNFVADPISDTEVNLSWTWQGDELSGFQLERRPSGGDWAFLPIASESTRTYSNFGLLPNTLYEFRIRAFNSVDESGYVSTSARTRPVPIVAPSDISGGSIFRTSAFVRWQDNSDDEDGFRIYRGLTPSAITTVVGEVAADQTQFLDPGLAPEETYYYAVKAFIGGAESQFVGPFFVTTLSDVVGEWTVTMNATIFNDPSRNCFSRQLQNTYTMALTRPNHQAVTLTGDGSSATGVFANDHVIIITSGSLLSSAGPVRPVALQLAISEDGTSMGGTSSVSQVGQCLAQLTLALGFVEPVVHPEQPAQLRAIPISSTAVSLTWQDRTIHEDGYRVERSLERFGGYSVIATLPANAESHTDSPLESSTEYWYRVSAFNASGAAFSEPASATTLAEVSPPAAPSSLSAQAQSSGSIRLTWQDNANDETAIIIERSLSGTSGFGQIDSVAANTTQYLDSGLDPASTYYYRVRATNADGNSAYSNVSSATTNSAEGVPAAPTNLEAQYLSLSSVTLSWEDHANNETAYVISLSTEGPNGPYRELGPLPANKTSEPITELSPCTVYWFRVHAQNSNGDSAFSNVFSWDVNVTAFITLTTVAEANSFVPGTFTIPCWDEATLRGGFAVHDANANGILDNEVTSGANRNFLYPRDPEIKNDGSGDWILIWGGKYSGNANLVLFFRFSSWSTVDRQQYIAVHLRVVGNSVSFVSLFAGDLDHPAPNILGPVPGVVMENIVTPSMTINQGQLPTSSELGFLQGQLSGATWFVTPTVAGTGEIPVTYGSGIFMDFNVPMFRDQ